MVTSGADDHAVGSGWPTLTTTPRPSSGGPGAGTTEG